MVPNLTKSDILKDETVINSRGIESEREAAIYRSLICVPDARFE